MNMRKCGDCQLCCKLLPMQANADKAGEVTGIMRELVRRGLADTRELNGMLNDFDKPAGCRCPHQRAGKGCTVYQKRPFGCRYWSCRWLVGNDTQDLPRPDRCGYVIDLMPDFIQVDGTPVEVVQVWVDPRRPDVHRDPKLRAYLARHGEQGKAAIVRLNASDGIILFPPALSSDGQWHERAQPANRPAFSFEELREMFDENHHPVAP
jgi:hypothetical protein